MVKIKNLAYFYIIS